MFRGPNWGGEANSQGGEQGTPEGPPSLLSFEPVFGPAFVWNAQVKSFKQNPEAINQSFFPGGENNPNAKPWACASPTSATKIGKKLKNIKKGGWGE